MSQKIAVPRDASAIILLSEDKSKILWAKRNPKLKFLGGFHGFTGGKVDENDSSVDVRNCPDKHQAELLACAVRETFEEIGILLVRNGDKLTKGQRASLHDDLISGRSTFAEILELWGLWVDAEDFYYTGFWTTPEFSRIRFKTRFFLAVCPPKQTPYQAITELQEIEFIETGKALAAWADSEVLIAPPVLISLQEIEKNGTSNLEKLSDSLLKKSQKLIGNINYIELNSRLICLPLKTETLPPATHTNCFIVGKKEFIVIDAATPFEDEQQKLFELIGELMAKGYVCKEIVVSHLHPDHFGGETALKKYLQNKHGLEVPISAHRITAESLQDKIEIDKFIEDRDSYLLQDDLGNEFELTALHTPGHARGHLCFYLEEFGFLLSSDNVVGQGTVVIAPPEGNMSDYLNSLERMKNLPNLHFLCGSHGSAVYNAKGRIEEYIGHRREREDDILQLVRQGVKDTSGIVEKIYFGLDPKLIPLARKSVAAHLEKLAEEGKISLAAQN
jgi:glyoxylase-like metal-dependent hydrolase (beta-lactamase superfamily II)/8-oxo-dGTP pyrophosphatase MutT (NUDIX family)